MSAIAPTTMSMPNCMPTSAATESGSTTTETPPDLPTIIQQLQTVAAQLDGIVAAYKGQQALTPTAPEPAPSTTTTTTTPSPTPTPSTDPLTGFTTTGDATEQATLRSQLGEIGSTTIGNQLLTTVRNKGIVLDIVDDATYDQRTGGKATDAVALFMESPNAAPTVLVRASTAASTDPAKLRHVLTHELTHAAQSVSGEGAASYAAGIGSTASTLSAAQLATGATLMKEAGAEFVAGAVDAQITNGAAFHVTDANIADASKVDWDLVNIPGYNPNGYALPQYVSPTAVGLVRAGAG